MAWAGRKSRAGFGKGLFMGPTGAMDAGEPFADGSGALHEIMPMRFQYIDSLGDQWRRSAQDQNGATLMLAAKNLDQRGPGSLKIHQANLQLGMQYRVVFQEARHLGTIRAEGRLSMPASKAWFDQKKTVTIHLETCQGDLLGTLTSFITFGNCQLVRKTLALQPWRNHLSNVRPAGEWFENIARRQNLLFKLFWS